MGCLGVGFLSPRESLLYKNKIILHDDEEEILSKSSLEKILPDQPNRRFLGLPLSPYVYLYHWGKQGFSTQKTTRKIQELEEKLHQIDTTQLSRKNLFSQKKIKWSEKWLKLRIRRIQNNLEKGNLLIRLGEKISIYHPEQEENGKNTLREYLSLEGFFYPKIITDNRKKGKLVEINYHVYPRKAYYIDSIIYKTTEPEIQNLLKSYAEKSMLKPGKRYAHALILKERERLHNMMRNKGYFLWKRKYIRFIADTTSLGKGRILCQISLEAQNKAAYKIYNQGPVHYHLMGEKKEKISKQQGHDVFHFKGHNHKLLQKKSVLKTNQPYHLDSHLISYRRLNQLGVFQFIEFQEDTLAHEVLTQVHLYPKKRYGLTPEFGFSVNQAYPSPFVKLTLGGRNVFKTWETIQISSSFRLGGLDSPAATVNPYSLYEYQLVTSLLYPDLLLPNWSTPFPQENIQYPQTRLSLSGQNANRQEYLRRSITSSLSYSGEYGKHYSFVFSPTELTFTRAEITPLFEEVLRSYGSGLLQSFQPSFINTTSLQVYWDKNYLSYDKQQGTYFKIFIKTGGNAGFLYRPLLNQLGLAHFSFTKWDGEYRGYVYTHSKGYLVWRLRLGIAFPYQARAPLPYEEYFFIGGSYSVRAWPPRRLGPGRFSTGFPQRTEQPGEILSESNLEYRHFLGYDLHMAIFLDRGNIWHIHERISRPGGAFSLRGWFYESALGGGTGIRYDLGNILLRLDLAAQIYDPSYNNTTQLSTGTWVIQELIQQNPFNTQRLRLNVGIGYPF
ncbi:MAG: BamA/TamA family outer membrane protein [Cytophagales bacterium]|nr:BamA/TamA family outer membrane protein [Cytophagales bacterium]